MSWKNIKIAKKLYIGFGVVLTIFALLSVYNYTRFADTGDDMKLVESASNNSQFMVEKTVDHLKWAAQVSDFFLDHSIRELSVQTDDHKCGLGTWLYGDELDHLLRSDPKLAALCERLKEPHYHVHASAVEISKVFNPNNPRTRTEAQEIFAKKTIPALESTQSILAEMQKHFQVGRDETSEHVNEGLINARVASIWVSLSAILAGIFIAFFIARGIAKPIEKVVKATEHMNQEFVEFESVLQAVANNDLTREVRSSKMEKININSNDEVGMLVKAIEGTIELKDRLGNSLKNTTTNLGTMIRQLGENARELVSAATEIASSAEQMSKGAKDQSDQVTQVSTAVEEMTATILESSKNAGEATNASKNASDTATSGGRIVNDTIQGMQKIAGVVRQSAESIAKLATSADQIGEIIGVIDDIADQTNLLALNAAIEAARAGEQGRGFAVVADEVRKLAERTGKATGEITEMIKGIQKETSEAVHGMEAGIQEVDKGRELADKAGNSLNEIVTMAQRVTDMIAQMATAAEEQSSAAEQISKNIEHITSVTRETASGAQQSAAAAEELNRQADGLQQMVAKFRING